MFAIRKSADRGRAEHGWLHARHSFSFAEYHDPNYMRFRSIRVINEDIIQPSQGFGTHPHHDMEIITYVLDGELSHKDNMGNKGIIRSGEAQGMSAGSGVTHSEFNASSQKPCHLLQIWIIPNIKSVTPAYSERKSTGIRNKWELIAAPHKQENCIHIHQDAKLLLAKTDKTITLPLSIKSDRFGWIQIAKGAAEINGNNLTAGDGVAFSGDAAEQITISPDSEILLFDLS